MEPDRRIPFRERSPAILSDLAMETHDRSSSTPQASKVRSEKNTGPLSLCLQNSAKCVYVSKQNVFNQALQGLSLEVHETKVCSIGNDEVIGSVCIDVPPHGEHLVLYQRKFFGDYKLTEEDALESAKLAALIYLQKAGIILVDDINLSELRNREIELKECQQKLLAASSWATLFQGRVESLKTELAAAREENKKLVDVGKLVRVKEEVLSAKKFDLKTDSITEDTSTPRPLDYQPGSSLLRREDQRSRRGADIKKALFRE